MTQSVQPREWRRFGFGGPPEPWPLDAQRDLDRLATSYYVEVLELRQQVLATHPPDDVCGRVEELCTTATRHKHEIDYTLRHWATPVERARVEDRLGSLMRISRSMRTLVDAPRPDGWTPDAA
ncbi:MAG TPA: hypothetical protein VFH63_06910 [candidate division Zixibacteria bacterium]|nr:hypothetical protein [candidate division Zixibacteria bacterium]